MYPEKAFIKQGLHFPIKYPFAIKLRIVVDRVLRKDARFK